ncbi:MAG: hypothetical protein WBD22_05985 [Pyrinomonadaceae bacterium]
MKRLRRCIAASTGFVLFVSVIALSVPQSGHGTVQPPVQDVRIVNANNETVPVDVQGAVRVRQQGEWSVGLSGTPTVQVGNSAAGPLLTRDVDRPTAQPFQAQAELNLDDGQNHIDVQIPVPAGKLLVIEFISLNGSAPPDDQIYVNLLTRVAPDPLYRGHYIQYEKQDFGSFNHYTANQMVRIYADPPSVTVRFSHFPATAVSFNVNISGYLVDK